MRHRARGALGIAVSALLLWYALKDVPFAQVVSALRASDLTLWALCTVASQLIFPLRARRWRTILDPVAPKLPFGPLWRATAIGMMANNVLPARAGELVRVFVLVRERKDVPWSAALASLAVDRVFDALCVVLLLVVAMLAPDFPRDFLIGGRPVQSIAAVMAAVVVISFGGLFAVAQWPRAMERLAVRLIGALLPRAKERVGLLVHALAAGLAVVREPSRFFATFAWALVHWLMNALAFWFGFRAVGIVAPFTAALFVQGIIVIGVSVPSSPGFVGVFETAAKLALPVYGVDPVQAVTWALGFHFLSFIPITVIGAWYFLRLGVHLGDVEAATKAEEQRVTGEQTGAAP
ncbi:MAG: flippase-like domain-containing protein [Gemmatimonadaceae bacterium]|nr:flippase-like domain-containing protein [Gemmatimonadaceae bacterium]